MVHNLGRPAFMLWLGTLLSLMTWAGCAVRAAKQDVKTMLVSATYSAGEAEGPREVPPIETDEPEQVEMPLDRIERSRQAGSNCYAVCYAVLAGQCGGLTMLFAKMLSEMLKTMIQVGGILVGWLTLAAATLSVLLVAMLLGQLRYLNAGLHMFDVLLVLPIYQASWSAPVPSPRPDRLGPCRLAD